MTHVLRQQQCGEPLDPFDEPDESSEEFEENHKKGRKSKKLFRLLFGINSKEDIPRRKQTKLKSLQWH